jgi:tRNA pseudouridine38-40 synthase
MRYLITVSYDGTNYKGYQTQPGLLTIQEQIENALTKINNGKKTSFTSSGRTDRGVHAKMQCGHADIDVNITEYKLKRAMNSNLPDDIHVIKTEKVNSDFHARYNVIEKTYEYYINIGEYNPIERNYVFQYNYPLNVEKMQEAIKYLIGEHDFRSFVTENREKENCIRTISTATVEKTNQDIIKFTFTGNGFLRYQIRNMVGILIRIGEEKESPEFVKIFLERKDRSKGGKTAPAEGLYLTNIKYKDKETV